jgi:DMSO/TMAO reductase YedYZ molybdopterin-dependent catalytic subunit
MSWPGWTRCGPYSTAPTAGTPSRHGRERGWTGCCRPARGSVLVTSVTGYRRRLPAADTSTLLLATHLGGAPLSAGHGAPVRLVAPSRRGFWWVKWVTAVELSDQPWWRQTPFPLH